MIDLDTVMPGLSLYDFGDSIRFGANHAAEDERDLSKVYCDLNLFAQYTKGYLEECGSMLTENEIRMLAFFRPAVDAGMRDAVPDRPSAGGYLLQNPPRRA